MGKIGKLVDVQSLSRARILNHKMLPTDLYRQSFRFERTLGMNYETLGVVTFGVRHAESLVANI